MDANDLTPEQIDAIAKRTADMLMANPQAISDAASKQLVAKVEGPITEVVYEAIFARLNNEQMVEHMSARVLERLHESGALGQRKPSSDRQESRWLRLVIELEEPNINRAGLEAWGRRIVTGEDWDDLEQAEAAFLPRSVFWRTEEYQAPES